MKREHIISGTEPLPPFSENLVFYAPLTNGDLTDHISGTSGSSLGGASVAWNALNDAYVLTTNTGASLSYQLDTPSMMPDSYTVVADVKVAQATTTFYIMAPGTYGGTNSYPNLGTHNFGISSDLSNWHRVVSVCDKTQLKQYFYLDSNLYNTVNRNSSHMVWSSNWMGALSSNLSLGVYYGYSGKAYLKDVRIYNRAFTASEVAQL